MSQKKDNIIFKVLLGILTICLIGLGIYTLGFHQDQKRKLNNLKSEKAEIEQKLKQIKTQYEKASVENNKLEKNLKKKKKNIESLLDSLKNIGQNIDKLEKYKIKTEMLIRQNKEFVKIVNNLSKQNKNLKQEIDSAKINLAEKNKAVDSLNQANSNLNKKLARSHAVEIENLKLTKVVESQDSLEICFQFNVKNPSGKLKLYFQVINPENNVINGNKSQRFGDKVLNYSKSIFVDPNSERFCESILLKSKNYIPGIYWVNIFKGEKLLASKEIELN